MILPLSFCIALWNICYMHLFFQDMEDDFNRIVDFSINFWVFFFKFLFKFYKCFTYVFGQFAMEAIKLIKWIHNLKLNCKYIYII